MGRKERGLGLAVVERIWDQRTAYSVRSLFDLLGEDERGFGPTIFRQTTASHPFLSSIRSVAADRDVRLMHIVAHGRRGKVPGNGKIWGVTHKQTAEAIQPGRGKVTGVYLAVCSLGRTLPLRIMRETDLEWIAYYNGSALWIPSACLETAFWYEFNHQRSIGKVAQTLNRHYADLSDMLGFRILARRRGALVPLIGPRRRATAER